MTGGYNDLENLGHKHLAVAERGDSEVAEEYLPIIHLVFSNLKSWLRGIHHGASYQHLQACLNEFTFRFNRRFYPFNAFRSLLGIAGDGAAPTYAELYSATGFILAVPARMVYKPDKHKKTNCILKHSLG